MQLLPMVTQLTIFRPPIVPSRSLKKNVGVAAAAFLVCAAIELFQLTGVPAQLAQEWPPIAWVLGVGFSAADLVAYAVGAVAAALVDSALRRAGAGRRIARA